MIAVDNVFYRYEEDAPDALCGLTLFVKDGEHVAVIGPNGCGKTTLIRHLNALLLPSSGSILVDGLDTQEEKNHSRLRQLVGMVFQNPDQQLVGMTVEEDIAFGPENLGLPPREIKKRVQDSLAKVGITELAKRHIDHLSGGEKRLTAIAGVLAMSPRYIAFDEPTAFLDPVSKERVLDLIDRLHEEGMGIIHITHDMTEAGRAQRIIVINKGYSHQEGRPEDIFRETENLKAIGLQLPPATEVLIQLRQAGLPVRTDLVHMEEAVKEISKLLKERLQKTSVQGLLDF